MRLRSLIAAYIFAGCGQAPVRRPNQRDQSLIVTMAGAPVERPSERHVSGSALRARRRARNWLNAAGIRGDGFEADWASCTKGSAIVLSKRKTLAMRLSEKSTAR